MQTGLGRVQRLGETRHLLRISRAASTTIQLYFIRRNLLDVPVYRARW